MKEDTEELEEVVVIGYGTAKKRDLTGAISTVKAESLEKETPRSVQDLLRANAPGISIGASVNAEGTASVQIRGKNTLSAGSSPLYVLDGVIFNGDLSDINPMDVQSIDVLKDASSVAVYGAKAANGVIAITTKKGKTGKPVVNFNSNFGWVQANSVPEVVDGAGFVKFRQEYSESLLTPEELAAKKGMYDDPRTLGSLGVDPLTWYNYDQSTPATALPSEEQMLTTWLGRLNFKNIEIQNYLNGVETDWTDLVFQTGFQQDYTASISNRTDNFSYFWSMGYADREGVKVGDRFKTFRTRLNLESKVTDFLTIGLNSSFGTKDKGALSADVGQRTNNSPFTTNEIDDPDSPYRMYPSGDNNTKNPFFDNLYRDRKDMEHKLNANIYAIVKLPFGFEYQMKEEAQANAEADKKEKERIDKLNQADSMIFQTEKQLKDLGDKLPADKKAPIETALNKLKEAHKAQDIAGIDAAMAELNSVFQAASQEMYNAQNAQGGAQPGPNFGQQTGGNASNNKQDGGVTDVDFEEVK
jgi:TonB-dependent starch-binding outer membrane protein SusC